MSKFEQMDLIRVRISTGQRFAWVSCVMLLWGATSSSENSMQNLVRIDHAKYGMPLGFQFMHTFWKVSNHHDVQFCRSLALKLKTTTKHELDLKLDHTYAVK